ncbi:MAG: S8 family serine peptidase [Eubacteriales bacterium]
MKKHFSIRLLSLLLVFSLFTGLLVPVSANEKNVDLKFEKVDAAGVSTKVSESIVDEEAKDVETNGIEYADDDIVRVSIVLEDESTVEKFNSTDIAANSSAISYREDLKAAQAEITKKIEAELNTNLDVAWNLTLAANLISANVRFGQIEAIENIDGVKEVVIENRYDPMVVDTDEPDDPNMSTSSEQIGSSTAWAAGYTGAGSRIAVIDTGIDIDHQSFSASGYEYSLAYQAGLNDMTVEEYKESLDLLDAEEIASVLDQLNIAGLKGASADALYQNSKVPFAYNYIDENNDITHLNDTKGEHGSHVEGIAAANAFIPNDDGTFSSALDTVFVQGVAPDAQIITMKVFGKGGGAYDSDYMAAIEDAIILGADSVNLSLGSGNPGFSRSKTYEEVMNSLAENGTVVTMSAGNSYNWPQYANNGTGYLYSDDVSLQTDGSPGSFSNALAVASVNNDGATGNYFTVAGNNVFYTETKYTNDPLTTLAGEQEYVFLNGYGDDFTGIDVTGKIVFVSRGSISFYQKAENAVNAGAIATIIYNNTTGTISMDLSSYTKTAPCVSITQADGNMIRENSTPSEDGTYYTGTMTVTSSLGSVSNHSDYYTMSSFSSWGVPGSLELKPEITAPGGNIYSVYGANGDTGLKEHDQYELMSGTSMAAPQVTGMAAVLAQYIRENGLEEKTGLTQRQLINSLLMSTAEPIMEEESGSFYSILTQGAGLANVGNAINADSYILVDSNLSGTASDGKVKAELGDDPDRTGEYEVKFSVNNLTDEAQEYTFSTDVFTQDIFGYNGEIYLDTWTAPMAANVTYTVNGETFVPSSAADCDLDDDGDTDADDAQIIINYVAGIITEIDPIADLDGDNEVTSYDAYLLLSGLKLAAVEVEANGSIDVTATITLTDATKEYLDAYYVNGAYVEAFINVETANTEDGEVLPAHSIPVLGFYGNWSDASMYDQPTLLEKLYGNTRASYLGVAQTNYLAVRYAGDSSNYIYTGNPYFIEAEYPTERAAISSTTTLYQYKLSLIRNAAGIAYFATNADNEVISLSSVTEQAASAYYYVNGSAWQNTSASLTMNQKVSALGLNEGDKFTAGIVAIPEYYETDGALTQDQVAELIESDTLGDGAYLSSTFTVDNTAPELLSVQKDLVTGAVTVIAQDNQYVAGIMIYKGTTSKFLDGGIPYQENPNEVCGGTFTKINNDNGGEYITVVVGDYAGNEAAYKVYYGGTPEDYSNRMFGFTSSNVRGSGQRWVEIDPEHVYYYSASAYEGMDDMEATDLEVYAAEYVDGYVFFATDTALYAAPQGEWNSYQKVATLSDEVGMIRDMAFNYQNKTLYALNDSNTVYSIDVISGDMTEVAVVTVTNPSTSATNINKAITAMTIDDEGNFYAVNYGTSTVVFLYKWTLADVVDGAVTVDPVNNTAAGSLATSGLYSQNFQSLAWDHDNDILYFGAGYGAKSNSDLDNELWVIDVTTAKAGRASDYAGGYSSAYVGRFQAHVVGLYVVPSSSQTIPSDSDVSRVEISKSEVNILKGATLTLTADVYPWTVADKTVTWSTSNENVVTVENGTITGVDVGTATVTATSNSDPTVSASCVVTVEKLDNIKFSGLVYDENSDTHWAEFETDDLENWTAVADGSSYIAGSIHEEEIIVHDGATMYGVDPDTFETTAYGSIASSWIWSDAAENPTSEDGYFGRIIGICNSGTFLEMINPAEGSLSYWNLSTVFADDPLAAITYIGSGTYDYVYIIWEYPDCPANFFYAMTESGKLYRFTVFTYTDGASYTMAYEEIGDTGIDLTGVASVTGGQYASMIYDVETGYLLISAYIDGDTAHLYAVSPEDLIPAEIGTFGADIWPVVSLYQYDRATDLTLKINPTEAAIYVGDSVTVSAKVVLGTTNELTWTTSDSDVATVDNGVITGVGEGTATITVTTVDVNSTGEHVSATVAVTVKPLTEINAAVKAQVTDENGTAWVNIDLNDMSTTIAKSNATAVTGGGYGADYLFASDVDLTGASGNGNIYRINPNTFVEEEGSSCSSSYAPLDVTDAPATTFTFTSGENTYTANAFGYPFYIANVGASLFLLDYVEGNLTGWNTQNYYDDLGAVAYVGDYAQTTASSSSTGGYDAGTVAHNYLALGADGTLYLFRITPKYNPAADEGKEVGYVLSRVTYGSIGMEFDDNTALSMVYVELSETEYGLIISDAADGSIYYADLSGEEITCGKVGTVAGAENITALYNAVGLELLSSVGTSATAAISSKFDAVETVAEPAEYLNANAPVVFAADAAAYAVDEKGAEVDESVVEAQTASCSANLVSAPAGSLNAADVNAVKTETAADDTVVTVIISEDVDVTNGKYVVTYDPEVLTYKSAASSAEVKAFNVDAEAGTVTFAFASTEAIAAGTTLAKIEFTYEDYVDTEITITTEERNDELPPVGEEDVVIDVEAESGEHDWVEIDSVEATCTEDGYVTYECSKCGETYTEVIKAHGHDFVTEKGYAGLSLNKVVCSRCGLVISGNSPLPVLNPITSPILNPSKGNKPVVIPKDEDDETVTEPIEETVLEPVHKELPFTDVSADDWFYTAVDYLYNEGIMNGTSDDEFSPDKELNRATIVTILYRMEGEPEVTTEGSFSDVPAGEWYSDAVEWAVSVGIVNGYEDGTFAPAKPVTRQELSAFIYRYAQYKGVTIYETNVKLSDTAVVSDWASESVTWAVSEGLLVDGENVNAAEYATRAEVAAAVYTYLTKTAK